MADVDLYQEIILEEYKQPQHFGKLANAQVTIPGINPSCGDALMLYLNLNPDQSKIAELQWDGQGCAISMAAMSVLAARINQYHLTPSQVLALAQKDLEAMLGLETITSGRVKCLMLGLQSLQAYFASDRSSGNGASNKT